MKRLIKLKEAAGKTLEKVVPYDYYFALIFDDSFVLLEAEHDDSLEVVERTDFEDIVRWPGSLDLVASGIVTQAEFDEMRVDIKRRDDEKCAKDLEWARGAERRQYETLKRKFGDT